MSVIYCAINQAPFYTEQQLICYHLSSLLTHVAVSHNSFILGLMPRPSDKTSAPGCNNLSIKLDFQRTCKFSYANWFQSVITISGFSCRLLATTSVYRRASRRLAPLLCWTCNLSHLGRAARFQKSLSLSCINILRFLFIFCKIWLRKFGNWFR